MAFSETGSPAVLRVSEQADPICGDDEVLVRVRGTSVNPIDSKIRSGAVPPLLGRMPMIPHGDMSGEIIACGSQQTQWSVGDPVFGLIGGCAQFPGAAAELVAVQPDVLAKAPPSLPLSHAAALPIVGVTALMMLDRAGLAAGQVVLVHGAAGGVGHVLIQLAKQRGAIVHATASTSAKQELAQACGADVVIPYQHMDVAEYVQAHTAGTGYDVVFDTVGGSCLADSMQAVADCGQVVTIAARSTQDLTPMHGKAASLHCVFVLRSLFTAAKRPAIGRYCQELAAAVDAGALRPHIAAQRFSMPALAEAHRYLEAGEHMGKIVVEGF